MIQINAFPTPGAAACAADTAIASVLFANGTGPSYRGQSALGRGHRDGVCGIGKGSRSLRVK